MEDKGKAHPQGFLTRFLTRDNINTIREQTEINSANELDYVFTEEFFGETLGIDFYMTGAVVYLGDKISKDRGSRKEAVEAIKGLSEQQKRFNTGLQITELSDAMEAQREGKQLEP